MSANQARSQAPQIEPYEGTEYELWKMFQGLEPIGHLDSLASYGDLPPLQPGTAYFLHQEARGSEQLTAYVIPTSTFVKEGHIIYMRQPPPQSDQRMVAKSELQKLAIGGVEFTPGGQLKTPKEPNPAFEEFCRAHPDFASKLADRDVEQDARHAIFSGGRHSDPEYAAMLAIHQYRVIKKGGKPGDIPGSRV